MKTIDNKNKDWDKISNWENWDTLPLSVMKHFDDAGEWSIFQLIWFMGNLENFDVNLSYLNDNSPVKNRGALLTRLNLMVKKSWIKKTPMGESGKHNKYSLNKEGFIEWLKVRRQTLESPPVDFTKSASGLSEVRRQTFKSPLADCTDKRDNFLDNVLDNKLGNQKTCLNSEPEIKPLSLEWAANLQKVSEQNKRDAFNKSDKSVIGLGTSYGSHNRNVEIK